jgi:hypothetical protein
VEMINPDFITETTKYNHILIYLLVIFWMLLNVWNRKKKRNIQVLRIPSVGITTFYDWLYSFLGFEPSLITSAPLIIDQNNPSECPIAHWAQHQIEKRNTFSLNRSAQMYWQCRNCGGFGGCESQWVITSKNVWCLTVEDHQVSVSQW